MCLMLDQFLWGHSSRVCDISCFLWGRGLPSADIFRMIVFFVCFFFFAGIPLEYANSLDQDQAKFFFQAQSGSKL